jgi:hypothetical protein
MTGITASGPGKDIADECPWCRTVDPAESRACLNCGRPVRTLQERQAEAATECEAIWPPPPPPPPPSQPRTDSQPTRVERVLTPDMPPTVAVPRARTLVVRHARRYGLGPSRAMVGVASAALAVAIVVVLWLAVRSRDSQGATEGVPTPTTSAATIPPGSATTHPAAPPLSPTGTTIVAPVATAAPVPFPTTASAPAPTAGATAAPTPTIAPVTTTLEPSQAPPQPSVGSPQVLNDPLPSGADAATVGPAFALAQRLADALAGGDWDTARSIDVDAHGASDELFDTGYRGLDRASLMLVDAVGQIARVPSVITPEAVRQDPSLDRMIRTKCRWSSPTT